MGLTNSEMKNAETKLPGLCDKLNIPHETVVIERAYRVRKFNIGKASPRPIIAAFMDYTTTENIMSKGRILKVRINPSTSWSTNTDVEPMQQGPTVNTASTESASRPLSKSEQTTQLSNKSRPNDPVHGCSITRGLSRHSSRSISRSRDKTAQPLSQNVNTLK